MENESGISSRFRPLAAPCDAVWKRSAAQPRRIRIFPCLHPRIRSMDSKHRRRARIPIPEIAKCASRCRKRGRLALSRDRAMSDSAEIYRRDPPSSMTIRRSGALAQTHRNRRRTNSVSSPTAFLMSASLSLAFSCGRDISLSGIVFFRLTPDARLRLWEIAKTAGSG